MGSAEAPGQDWAGPGPGAVIVRASAAVLWMSDGRGLSALSPGRPARLPSWSGCAPPLRRNNASICNPMTGQPPASRPLSRPGPPRRPSLFVWSPRLDGPETRTMKEHAGVDQPGPLSQGGPRVTLRDGHFRDGSQSPLTPMGWAEPDQPGRRPAPRAVLWPGRWAPALSLPGPRAPRFPP